MLATSALLAMDEGREHSGGDQEARGHARSRKVQEHGPGPPAGLLVLHPGAGLHRAIPARTIGEAVTGRVGRGRAEHQAGEPPGQLRVAEPQPIHGARTEGFHDDVRVVAQPEEHISAAFVLEVDHDRPPAAIPYVVPGLSPKGVSPRRFDLDHVRAEFGEEQHANGSGHAPAEVEHAHAGERDPLAPSRAGRHAGPAVHAPSSPRGRRRYRHFVDHLPGQDYSSSKNLGRVPSHGDSDRDGQFARAVGTIRDPQNKGEACQSHSFGCGSPWVSRC